MVVAVVHVGDRYAMAAARAREVFRGAIQRMGVTANTPVGEQ